jgi:hypothetical protein
MGSLRLGVSHLLIVFAHSLSEVAIQGAKSNKNVCAPKCTGQRYDKKSEPPSDSEKKSNYFSLFLNDIGFIFVSQTSRIYTVSDLEA